MKASLRRKVGSFELLGRKIQMTMVHIDSGHDTEHCKNTHFHAIRVKHIYAFVLIPTIAALINFLMIDSFPSPVKTVRRSHTRC